MLPSLWVYDASLGGEQPARKCKIRVRKIDVQIAWNRVATPARLVAVDMDVLRLLLMVAIIM